MIEEMSMTTKGGVTDLDEPHGTVAVTSHDGDTVVDLEVTSEDGVVTVHLDRAMLTDLMVMLGAAAHRM